MGIYYIKTADGSYFEMDATTDMTISYPGRATDFPLEDGESASDHYINENTRITFSGVITDIKSAQGKANPRVKATDSYINGLKKAKDKKLPFTVFYAEKLEPITNCVFESLEISQDNKNGTSGPVSSYKINFTAKQIRFGKAATNTTVTAPVVADASVEKAASDKSDSSGNTLSTTENESGKTRLEVLEAKTAAEEKALDDLIASGVLN